MSTKETEKSIELYKVVLVVVAIVIVAVIIGKVSKKNNSDIIKENHNDISQASISQNKTAKPIKVKLETTKSGKTETQEFDFDAMAGESIRFMDFYIIPQEVTDETITFKFDASSSLKEYDSASKQYVKKDIYSIKKGSSIKFSDGITNENVFTVTY
jgi:mannitol-specific phosphotransferase system IIBC component